MAWTSSIYDLLNYIWPIWPGPSTYLKMFQMALFLLEDNSCAKLFWNPCINVQVMARKTQYMTILTFIWPLRSWPSNYLKNVSNGTVSPRGQQLCKIILKSKHKCTSYGPDKLNIWQFWPLFEPCDIDFKVPKMFQMALFLLKGNNCAKLLEIHA